MDNRIMTWRGQCGWVAVAVLVVMSGVARTAWAQGLTPLRGTVIDAQANRPVGGATVRAGATSVRTDGEGRFTIDLPPGTVAVSVEAQGFLSESRPVTVVPGQALAPLEILLVDRKSTRLNSSHSQQSRMPSSA